jgi:hypothetical protein
VGRIKRDMGGSLVATSSETTRGRRVLSNWPVPVRWSYDEPRRSVMPSSEEILDGLTTIANAWWLLSLAWHLAFGILALLVLAGSRPSKPLMALMLATLVVSVSALAWIAGNPFNGVVFAILAVALVGIGLSLPRDPITVGSGPLLVFGTVLVVFGWTYPHFLEANSWTSYLYAAPLGLVPCPTLSMLVGVSLIVGGFESKAWANTVAAAALSYGVIGVFTLGVAIDVVVLAGAMVLWGTAVSGVMRMDARRKPTLL